MRGAGKESLEGVMRDGGEGGDEEGGTHLTFTFGVTKLAINCLAVFDIYNSDKKKFYHGAHRPDQFFLSLLITNCCRGFHHCF